MFLIPDRPFMLVKKLNGHMVFALRYVARGERFHDSFSLWDATPAYLCRTE